MTANSRNDQTDGATMDAMPTAPAHARPAHRDHLWVLAIIAAFALFDVWGAWAQVGDKSGFAVGHVGTGWTLTVIVEAAAGYFLFAWFSAPGRRSRRFAMGSAFATLTLSLIGQGASSFAAKAQLPPWLAVFVKDLPVVVLALIAVLIHMRRLDREDAAEAAEADSAAGEVSALRAELRGLREARAAAEAERDDARRETAAASAKIETLTRKLAAAAPRKRTPQKAARTPAAAPRSKPAGDPATEVPNDVDAQAEALSILAAEPGISGAKLAERVGMSERWGQTFKKNLTASPAGPGDDAQETP
jgi:hypothetical protein